MKITLPIKGYYRIPGNLRGSYRAALGIENLNFSYIGNVSEMGLGFGVDSINAEFIPGSLVRPLSIGHALSSADAQLSVASETVPIGIGIGISAETVFKRSADESELSVGFKIAEASAALVRKTILSDFDGLTLAEMDEQLLYDLAYITIE